MIILQLKENLSEINYLIKNACEKVNRNPNEVRLLAVSKAQPTEKIIEAFNLGLHCFGENYAQELIKKYYQLPESIRNQIEWHFIGLLQKNKVKKILPIISFIQSVNSFSLAQEIDKQAAKLNLKAKILIEVNITREKTRKGIMSEDLNSLIKAFAALKNIEVQGLMCIAPLIEKEKTRLYFKEMKQLFDSVKKIKQENLKPSILSMGMSNDFEIAIQEGSTMIRIGTKLFGERT